MYMWMGFLLLSDCRKRSCAITRLATLSSICRWRGQGCSQIRGGERVLRLLGMGQRTRKGDQGPNKRGGEEFRTQKRMGRVVARTQAGLRTQEREGSEHLRRVLRLGLRRAVPGVRKAVGAQEARSRGEEVRSGWGDREPRGESEGEGRGLEGERSLGKESLGPGKEGRRGSGQALGRVLGRVPARSPGP